MNRNCLKRPRGIVEQSRLFWFSFLLEKQSKHFEMTFFDFMSILNEIFEKSFIISFGFFIVSATCKKDMKSRKVTK